MPPAEIKESIYPEHMTADELARALLDLANEFDAYDFMDQVESSETALTEIKDNLLAGLGMREYASFLKDVKEESKELASRAEALRDRLREYTPELTDEIQPMVKIWFSQDSNIKEGSIDILEEGIKEVSSGKESESVMQTKPAKEKAIDEASKKSIHARLQEKKNELAKKPEKDNPQRGVELA